MSGNEIPIDAKTWLTIALYDASQNGYDLERCQVKAEWLLEQWRTSPTNPGSEPVCACGHNELAVLAGVAVSLWRNRRKP
jgi:hypothetical protein